MLQKFASDLDDLRLPQFWHDICLKHDQDLNPGLKDMVF